MNKYIAIRMFVDKDDQSKFNIYNNNGSLYCIDKENKIHKLRFEKHNSYIEDELKEIAIKYNLREIGTRVVNMKSLSAFEEKEYKILDYLDQI